jgi:hypothetical protein
VSLFSGQSHNDKIVDARATADKAVTSGDKDEYTNASANSKKAETGRNLGFGMLGLGVISFGASFAF